MKKFVITGVLSALLLTTSPLAHATVATTTAATDSRAAMLLQIQQLMKLIADLQAQLATARGELKTLVRDLRVGSEGEDVKAVQEILASDPALFNARPTGFYGPLTEAAIRRFQERYELPVTGVVDEATREVMRELGMERKDGKIPPGLVRSDEVKSRVKERLKERWKECDFERKYRSAVCEKVKEEKSKTKTDDTKKEVEKKEIEKKEVEKKETEKKETKTKAKTENE